LARILKRKKKCETLEGFFGEKNGPTSSNNEGINK
jgi:hypothetical protein